MIIPKYLTHIKINNLYKICKILNVINYKNQSKKYIINKINLKILNLLSNEYLHKLWYQLTNKYIKRKNKRLLIYQINSFIKKKKNTNSISIFWNNNLNKVNNNNLNKFNNNNLNKVNNNNLHKVNNNNNNESFGITCEYILCKIYNLSNNLESRINNQYILELNLILNKFKAELLTIYNLKCIEYIGYNNNMHDFICQNIKSKLNYTLSIKSNKNYNTLVCPQVIGQCTFNSLVKYIQSYKKNIKINTKYQLKKFIKNNLLFMFNIYFKNLFCCDYLLWIYKNKDISYVLLKKPNTLKIKSNLLKLNNNISKWRESNILKYNNKSIGQFQIHNNRNCIKFRFYMNNLLNLVY
jgi:hypothetical protein